MSFRPLGQRIIVQKDAPKGQTSGGLFVPDNARQVVTEGTVLSVGSEVLDVCAGDRVLFGARAGTEVQLHGETVFVFREEDIWGVFE